MVEPPTGIPGMPPEPQDLHPCAPDVPLPVATRTRQYLNRCGPGPGPRDA